ncbi:hypothetical protein B0J17DRAFT_708584 [Rhizoctonia solani]|nr:hypothetical protein B0J17DRAFT_708584 [Rhizoctonia solani]
MATRGESHVECAYVLTRLTESSEMRQLEFCWECEPETLDLNVPENLVWLSPEWHTCFVRNHWTFVPSLELLHNIREKTVSDFGRKKSLHFTKRFPICERQYFYVRFIGGEELTPHYDNASPCGATLHQSPFTTVPPILSQVHPYFVICDAATKDLQHWPELESESESERRIDGYETLDGHGDPLRFTNYG